MTALVDTSVLVGAAFRPGDLQGETWSISAITVGELEAGVLLARKKAVRAHRLRRLSAVLALAPILSIDSTVATRYGELRAASSRRPSNDLWIAATALAHDLTLVTRDRELAAVPLIRAVLIAGYDG